MNIAPFRDFIKGKCGLCFDESRTIRLIEGISARMSENGIGSDYGYLALLRESDAEFLELVNLLTVNETYFYREPVHIELLVEKIIPRLIEGSGHGRKAAIMSAGCSTGEEPYSLVMALIEKHGAGIMDSVSVTGTDIDSEALGKAHAGVYYPHSFRGFDRRLIDTYFENTGNGLYRIKEVIRRRVKFEQLNLLSDAYPATSVGVDVIFYRNVSIYFDPETQKEIFRRMAGLLNENGYLFVSATETMSHNFGVLPLIELDGVFLYQKKTPGVEEPKRAPQERRPALQAAVGQRAGKSAKRAQSAAPVAAVRAAARSKEIAVAVDEACRNKSKGPELFERALSMARGKEYENALGMIDNLLTGDPSFIRGYMLRAGILLNMQKLDEAEEACLTGIRTDRWDIEGYLLMGLIARTRRDEETAMKRFKEALYIKSSSWLAHFYIAEIYRGRRENEKARREYEIVSNLLRKGGAGDHGLTFFPFPFPVEQIIHVCEHNLSMLKGQGK